MVKKVKNGERNLEVWKKPKKGEKGGEKNEKMVKNEFLNGEKMVKTEG